MNNRSIFFIGPGIAIGQYMGYRHRPLGLFFLVLMIIMALQVALKKPLCIDSNVVYKIDKTGPGNTETVYSCNQFKKVSFSSFFYDNLNSLEARFTNLETVLVQLGVTGKFIVSIDDVNKNQIQELTNGIQIGTNLLSTNRLEKMILELSLKNKLNISDKVFLETLSDFFIGDSKYRNLVSEAWGESFKDLAFFEKRRITKILIRKLIQNSVPDDAGSIDKLKTLLAVSSGTVVSDSFSKNLKRMGYYTAGELAEHKLDIIIEAVGLQTSNAELISQAKNHPHLKIAISNESGMFLLPSNLKVPVALERNLFAKYRLIFDSKKVDKSIVARYTHNSESLILIRSKTEANKLNLSPMFASGVNEFLSRNKQIDFIQIHLPSYKLKYKDLSRIADYFDFVRIKNLSGSEHKALGWSHTEWLKDLRVFRPIANYDVIQYFRIN